jgi:hypothetical protein
MTIDMSSSSSSSTIASLPSLSGNKISEKLTRDNYLLWRAQVMPPIMAVQLEGILDGSMKAPTKLVEVIKDDKTNELIPNTLYATWLAQDQLVLGHLLNSLTKDVLGQVAMASSSAEVWETLENMFSTQSRARVQLATLKKGSLITIVYFNKMKTIADELAATGKKVDDEEMVSVGVLDRQPTKGSTRSR